MCSTVRSERQLLHHFVASIACAVVEKGGRNEEVVDGWHEDDFRFQSCVDYDYKNSHTSLGLNLSVKHTCIVSLRLI